MLLIQYAAGLLNGVIENGEHSCMMYNPLLEYGLIQTVKENKNKSYEN